MEEDLATHADVVSAVFRPHTGGAAGFGGSAGYLQAVSAAALDAANGAAAARAAAAADQRTPGGGAADSEDIADAATAAAAGGGGGGGGGHRPAPAAPFKLPSPALPHELVAFAGAYAAKVDDLNSEAVDPMPALRKAGAPPSTTYELTPSTKLAFAPTVHAHAFELADAKGWFGSSKLVLRAMSQEDLVDWICAINAMVEVSAMA
jgi:hypothetical protein